MEVYKVLEQHADKPDIEKLVNQYLKEGKAKRVEFKDVLVEGCYYQQK